jgi:hypothetical protein
LPKLETWELLGLFLTSGGSAFGLIYATPNLAALTLTFRGQATFSLVPEASLGLAGLSLTALVSVAAIIVQQLKPPDVNVGAALIIWTNFVVNLIGDALFYSGYVNGSVLLIGLVSAALTIASLLSIASRPRAGAAHAG